jgi:uncharacterized protein YjiS (DUF1127 family)
MSTLFGHADALPRFRRSPGDGDHQPSSWAVLLGRWLACSERAHQRAGLHAIADDPHLLADLGLTRDEALEEAHRPFWR